MSDRELKYGILLSYIYLAANNLINIIFTPVLIIYLGQAEFGLYSLAISIISYLSVMDMGLGNTVVRYTTLNIGDGRKCEIKNLFGTFIKIYAYLSVCTLIIGCIAIINWQTIFDNALSSEEIYRSRIMFSILLVNLVISLPLNVFGSIITAYQRFVFLKTLAVLRIILQPILMLPLLFYSFKGIALVSVICALNIAILFIQCYYCVTKLNVRISFGSQQLVSAKELFAFSGYIFVGMIVDKINWAAGQTILGIKLGTLEVAVYAIAIQILLGYFAIASSISGLYLPRLTNLSKVKNQDDEILSVFINVGRFQLILLLLVLTGFILYGQEFIQTWAGKEYSDAYWIILIVMLPMTLSSIQHIGSVYLQAINRQKFRTSLNFSMSIVNVVLGAYLADKYNGIGCALSWSFTILMGNILFMNLYYEKCIGLNIKKFWRSMLSVFPIVCVIFFGYMIKCGLGCESNLYLFLNIAIYTTLYSIIFYLYFSNEREKKLIRSVLIKCSNVYKTKKIN